MLQLYIIVLSFILTTTQFFYFLFIGINVSKRVKIGSAVRLGILKSLSFRVCHFNIIFEAIQQQCSRIEL